MDRTILKSAYDKLKTIKDGIANGAYVGFKGYCDTDGWGGAGLLVTTVQLDSQESNFYPDPRSVVTPYAHEIGWLITRLWELFSSHKLLDCCTKIEFLGRLGNAAVRYQQSLNGRPENIRDFLDAVYQEAHNILDEMAKDEFDYLTVAANGRILGDNIRE